MTSKKKIVAALLTLLLAFSLPASVFAAYDGELDQVSPNLSSLAEEYGDLRYRYENENSWYCYTLKLNVENPFNSADAEYKQVGKFRWSFTYRDRNGFGDVRSYILDLSWDSSKGRVLNKALFDGFFVRKNDDAYDCELTVWLPGVLEDLTVQLDMDGAGFLGLSYERVSVTVKEILCAGTRINANTDYVSSSVYVSEAEVRCEMPQSRAVTIDGKNVSRIGPAELEQLLEGLDGNSDIRDQYGARVSFENIDDVLSYPGSINQNIDHSDEPGMYLYTIEMRVTNPINIEDGGNDACEDFRFTFSYVSDNGLGAAGTYELELASGSKYRNKELMNLFQARDDEPYDLDLELWIPGILQKVDVLLNMNGGERLSVEIQSVSCSGRKVSVGSDYVSSAYYDSEASVSCHMEKGKADLLTIARSQSEALSKIRSLGKDTDLTDAQLEAVNDPERTYLLATDTSMEGVRTEDVTAMNFSTYAPWNSRGRKEANDKTFWCTKELIRLHTSLENTFILTGMSDCYVQFALVSAADSSVSLLTDEMPVDSDRFEADLNALARTMPGFADGSYEVGVNFRYDPESSVPKSVRTALSSDQYSSIRVTGDVVKETKTGLSFEAGLQWLEDGRRAEAGGNVCSGTESFRIDAGRDSILRVEGMKGSYMELIFLSEDGTVYVLPGSILLASDTVEKDLGSLYRQCGGSGDFSVMINLSNPIPVPIRDQYGSLASDLLIDAALAYPELYVYEYSRI